MGDGVDMALDNAWDDWEQKEEWINNGRDPNEGYELGILNEMGGEIGDSRLPSKPAYSSNYTKAGKRKKNTFECKYCGKKNLQWKEVDGKWRLHDKKLPHVCEKYKKE
jgi:hypothetical protein